MLSNTEQKVVKALESPQEVADLLRSIKYFKSRLLIAEGFSVCHLGSTRDGEASLHGQRKKKQNKNRSSEVISHLRSLFGRHGISEALNSDNGLHGNSKTR